MQYVFEQILVRTDLNPDSRTSRYLILAERRIADLNQVIGTEKELSTIPFVDAAVDQAGQAIQESGAIGLDSQMSGLISDLQLAADSLLVVPEKNTALYNAFKEKIATFRILFGGSNAKHGDFSRLGFISLPFPSELQDIVRLIGFFYRPNGQHPFPLTGRHALLDCEVCHTTSGVYTGLASTCESCHAKVKPANHYDGSCAACHTAITWKNVHFDHELARASDCLSCHVARRPQNHFQVQCAFCHNTHTFKGAKPDHELAQAKDCISCHRDQQPANHFDRQCSDCHQTTGWTKFSTPPHANSTGIDCVRCHEKTKPVRTYRRERFEVLALPQSEGLETA